MADLKKLLKNIYKKIAELKRKDEYKKCLRCDCYYGLFYYMKEEMQKIEEPTHKEMLKDILSTFDKRKDVNIQQCLGCDPCPPAEWTTELIKNLK
jgi:hypothetical protein